MSFDANQVLAVLYALSTVQSASTSIPPILDAFGASLSTDDREKLNEAGLKVLKRLQENKDPAMDRIDVESWQRQNHKVTVSNFHWMAQTILEHIEDENSSETEEFLILEET